MSCGCHSVKKPVLGRYLLIWQVRKAGSNFEVSKRKTGTRSDFHNCNWNWTQFFSKKEMDPQDQVSCSIYVWTPNWNEDTCFLEQK